MYKLTHIIGFLLFCSVAYGVETTLETEVPMSYVFFDMTPSSDVFQSQKIRYTVTFGGDGVSLNEAFIMRIYADKYSTTPLYIWDWISASTNTSYEITYAIRSSAMTVLQDDSEGRIEFELTDGTITILSVEVQISDGTGGSLNQTLTVPDYLNELTPNGTPYFWLANLGYNSNWELAELDDPDNDGFLNWQEYTADTNPNNGSDFLKIGMSGGTLNFDSSSSCRYSITYCNNLHCGTWNLLTNNISGSGGVVSISPSHADQARYYQVQAERTEN